MGIHEVLNCNIIKTGFPYVILNKLNLVIRKKNMEVYSEFKWQLNGKLTFLQLMKVLYPQIHRLQDKNRYQAFFEYDIRKPENSVKNLCKISRFLLVCHIILALSIYDEHMDLSCL